MPGDFYIDAKLGVVFSKVTGVLTLADVLDHMERLVRHPDFRPEFNQLLDFREATNMALSNDEVRGLARKNIFSALSRRAFVVSSDLQFGLSRVFATHRELLGEGGILVFREMQEALNWLALSSVPDARVFARLHPPAGGT
ncbi:MAG: hypothetical protein HY301_11740 [Verrucomicrobia bacterium]|nr:hypothetical protein [Verrucomicrobiota bacterium]